MNPKLVQLVEGHPALQHPLFLAMSDPEVMSPRVMRLFLNEMGAFCAASRDYLFHLGDTLLSMNEMQATLAIRQIARSEAGHEPQFEAMAAAIMAGTGLTISDMATLASTWTLCRHFAARREKDAESAMRSLGVLVAVELLAHRHIIPGEMKVFIESGRFSIDDPGMKYLSEHAGESGAEAEHENLVLEDVVPLEERYGDHMLAGAQAFLNDVDRWYTDLHSYIGL